MSTLRSAREQAVERATAEFREALRYMAQDAVDRWQTDHDFHSLVDWAQNYGGEKLTRALEAVAAACHAESKPEREESDRKYREWEEEQRRKGLEPGQPL